MNSRVMGTLLASAIAASACQRGDSAQDAVPIAGRSTYDVSAIDVASFLTDPSVRRRVLYMPFGEAAVRLGSMHFDASSEFAFTRGGERYGQRDRWQATQDDIGSFEVHLETPVDSVDFYLVGEHVAVRQDHGKLRKKPRREVETEAWTEIAFSSRQQILEIFRPHLEFIDPEPETLANRPATRYRLALSGEDGQQALPPMPAELPIGAPAKWRELAQPQDIKGNLWVDDATGVALGLQLEGRLEIPDREVRPTQLSVSYEGRVTRIGDIEPIVIPEGTITEYQRVPPPRNPLGFFEDRLPKDEP